MRKPRDTLSCKDIQKMIVLFIQNELSDDDKVEFIDHVNGCPACKEEYEVYYILLTGMKMLEEDKANGRTAAIDSDENLIRVEEQLIKKKMNYIKRRVFLIAIILIIAFLLEKGI